jgi:hypothetical protein
MWLFPKCPGALVKNGWSLDMAISLVSWSLGKKWLEFGCGYFLSVLVPWW